MIQSRQFLLLVAAGYLLIIILLSGCATPAPKIEYREVKVAVPVPCKTTEPVVPEYATGKVDLASPIFELVRAVLIELEQRKAETVELRAANRACAQ